MTAIPNVLTRPSVVVDGEAMRDITPVLIAVVPFAIVVGVTIAGLAIPAGPGYASSLLIFAGSAQMAVLALVGAGAGAASVLVTVAVVNARLMVYGAGLAPLFSGQPTWFRWLAPHLMVDQMYAIASARPELADRERFRRYWLTAGIALGVVWMTAVAVGLLVGPVLPEAWPLEVTSGAMFVSLLVPRLTDRAAVLTTIVTAAAVAVTTRLPSGAGLILSVALGVTASILVTWRRRQP